MRSASLRTGEGWSFVVLAAPPSLPLPFSLFELNLLPPRFNTDGGVRTFPTVPELPRTARSPATVSGKLIVQSTNVDRPNVHGVNTPTISSPGTVAQSVVSDD